MNKKSIAIVIKCLLGNGAEKVVQNQSALLHKYGHDVHIFCFTDTQEIPIDKNVPIHIFPVKRLKWLPSSYRKRLIRAQLERFIEKTMGGSPDIVLSHLNAADRILSESKFNVAMFIHMHVSNFYLKGLSKDKRQNKIEKMRTVYEHRKCIAVSEGVGQDFKQILPKCDIQTIYNPLNSNYVADLAKLTPNAAAPPEQYVVHIGSLTQVKQHALLLEAYSLSSQFSPLLIIGKGPEEEAIRSKIKELNLEKTVTMIGFTDNPYPYLLAARGLILSSESEALPTVILEAISLNTPVISTDCPCGPREMLPEANLVPNNDPQALAQKIDNLIGDPEKFRSTLSPKFSEEYIINQYLELV